MSGLLSAMRVAPSLVCVCVVDCVLFCAHAHRFIPEHVLKWSSPVRPVCIPVILVLVIFKL